MPGPVIGFLPSTISALVGAGAALFGPGFLREVRRHFNRDNKNRDNQNNDDLEPKGDAAGAAPFPENEALRMNKLRGLSILDTDEHDAKFDDITGIVSSILGVPIAAISLVAEDRQWFKSRCGLLDNQTGRDVSFCAFTLLPKSPCTLIVPDARVDQRFAENPLVLGDPFIRFFAGCPLVTSDGYRLGSFCLIDRVPRVISVSQQQFLINFAELITRQLEANQLAAPPARGGTTEFSDESAPTSKDFECGKLRADRMQESLREPLLLVSMNPEDSFWPILYANEEWAKLTKLPIRSNCVFNVGGEEKNQIWAPRDFLQCLEPLDAVLLEGTLGSFIRNGACFGLNCVTKTPERINITCRFQPADKPLDAAAEAIQLVSDEACGVVPDPDEPLLNRLYFVIMTKAKSQTLGLGSSPSTFSMPTDRTQETKKAFQGTQAGSQNEDLLGKFSGIIRETMESLCTDVRPLETPFSDARLVRSIGRGSFAQVFYGLWLGQACAVKVVQWTKAQPGSGSQSISEARPIFEGALSVELSHPNLVQTYKHTSMVKSEQEDLPPGSGIGSGSGSGRRDQFETWIVQEWCDMGTLMAHINVRSPMQDNNFEEVLGICVDISSAMTYMHGRNIIHGDLTANNVLLTRKRTCTKGYMCKVSDFGLSRIIEGSNQGVDTQQLGTLAYMPPELFKKSGWMLSLSADVYAIGVLMWQIYTGQVPFHNLSAREVIVRILGAAHAGGLSLPAGANPTYAQLFQKCTDRDPDRRLSAQVVLDTLLDVQTTPDYTRTKSKGARGRRKSQKSSQLSEEHPTFAPHSQPMLPYERQNVASLSSSSSKEQESLVTFRSNLHGTQAMDLLAFRGFPFKDHDEITRLYEQQSLIARGQQGKVFRCQRMTDKKVFAMKKIHLPGRLIRVEFVENLKSVDREIRTLKQVSGSSPYIVRLEDYWFTRDFTLACLVMEFLPLNLHLIIGRQKKLSSAFQHSQIWCWLAELVQGLHAIHEAGIIHRDLKPTNVLLTDDSCHCKIADFGVARSCVQDSMTPPRHTGTSPTSTPTETKKDLSDPEDAWTSEGQTGLDSEQEGLYTQAAGTPAYSSPEKDRGEVYGQKSDIFSLGCLLYEIATLQKAFGEGEGFSRFWSDSPDLLFDQHICDENIIRLCISMMKFDSDERPDTSALKIDAALIQHITTAQFEGKAL